MERRRSNCDTMHVGGSDDERMPEFWLLAGELAAGLTRVCAESCRKGEHCKASRVVFAVSSM